LSQAGDVRGALDLIMMAGITPIFDQIRLNLLISKIVTEQVIDLA
jgi:hypothetical protein